MGYFRSNSWSLALIFCTHAKKNPTFNLSKYGGQIQHILFFTILGSRKMGKIIKIQKRSERRTACWNPPLKSWNEFRDKKMEKGTSQFFRSAGRCGAMRHGVHAGMPLGCPLPACSWGNSLIFQKTLIFRKSPQICGQGMQPRHAAKSMAKACIQGEGQGMLAKAAAAPYGHAGQGR